MLKHIGTHNGKKVVVVFRQIPGDEHLALVVYTDNIPSPVHDDLMKCVEGLVGQQVHELSEALHRTILTDGRNALAALHSQGYLKKAQTSQVIMRPRAGSNVRLDELNRIINELATGEEAKNRLATNDAAAGIVDPNIVRAGANASANTALSDVDIANNMLTQAKQMEVEAKALLAESKRVIAEAKAMMPAKATPAKATPTKAATAKASVAKKSKATA